MVAVLGPSFRTAVHVVRTQHGVTASAGQRRGDVEIRWLRCVYYLWDQAGSRSLVFDLSIANDRFGSSSYLRDQAGSRSLVFELSISHDRFGSSSHVQQNGHLSHPQDLDGPVRHYRVFKIPHPLCSPPPRRPAPSRGGPARAGAQRWSAPGPESLRVPPP